MVEIGKYNKLRVIKELEFGIYLDGGNDLEILLPRRYVPENIKPDDELEVFIYTDSEDRLIATTENPYATVGEFALLTVVAVEQVGAFLDWGLMKDLLVPYREQKATMQVGNSYVVYVYLDEKTNRVVASGKVDKFLNIIPANYEVGQEVNLMIFDKTDLGYNAIIEQAHWGLIYKNELFQPLERGQRIKGFIKKIYVDGKIDLTIYQQGYKRVSSVAQDILGYLNAAGGFIAVNDKTPPEDIHDLFQISKKSFKMAIGALYKEKLIEITDEGIKLASK